MNAKKELLSKVNANNILCAYIYTEGEYNSDTDDYDKDTEYLLKTGYTKKDLQIFLKSIDFEYDGGWGSQVLFGVVWFTDGTWLERGEYDGSERREHKICPTIPDNLK